MMVVIGTLVAGMTLASGVLLVLEPGPVAPWSGITLQSINRVSTPEQRLFDTAGDEVDWQAIVIHDSGTLAGSSRTLNDQHERLGRGGLGYHFVINNGSRQRDGLIEVGFRWSRQFAGHYLTGERADWFHTNAIGICLVGDVDRQRLSRAQLRELAWLVEQLQQRYDIPRDAVYVDVGTGDSDQAVFPHDWFQQQIAPIAQR